MEGTGWLFSCCTTCVYLAKTGGVAAAHTPVLFCELFKTHALVMCDHPAFLLLLPPRCRLSWPLSPSVRPQSTSMAPSTCLAWRVRLM